MALELNLFFFFLMCVFFFFLFLAMQVHPPGMESPPSAVEVGTLNHWTAREVPELVLHK